MSPGATAERSFSFCAALRHQLPGRPARRSRLTGGAQGVALAAPAIGGFSFESQTEIAGIVLGRSVKLYYLAVFIALLRGAILGAIFVTALPPVLRTILGDDVKLLGLNAPQLNQVVFGLAIVVFLTLAPGGLARFNLRWLDNLRAPKAARRAARPPAGTASPRW